MDSSVGRVYLAHLPSALTMPVLRAQQERGVSSTLASEHLEAVLYEVRKSGFSITKGGVIPGLSAIAAPVFASGPGVALALGIAVPTHILTASIERSLIAELTSTAESITRDLGGDLPT
ncbi:IclR family transcriptional regulator domain-containing protein [Thermocatellispora tengchongensis]|uniref:IclR family transcriptional regulator domain-containing protein n=1 Tax=Thermocatellispora tengchongensis TaxID=1073253 RepID=UPI003628DB03